MYANTTIHKAVNGGLILRQADTGLEVCYEKEALVAEGMAGVPVKYLTVEQLQALVDNHKGVQLPPWQRVKWRK